MTILFPDLLLRGGRFVASRGGKSRLGEFARICRRRRSCDSFPNRPYGRPILLCPMENEGMSELYVGLSQAIVGYASGSRFQRCEAIHAWGDARAVQRSIPLTEEVESETQQKGQIVG